MSEIPETYLINPPHVRKRLECFLPLRRRGLAYTRDRSRGLRGLRKELKRLDHDLVVTSERILPCDALHVVGVFGHAPVMDVR